MTKMHVPTIPARIVFADEVLLPYNKIYEKG